MTTENLKPNEDDKRWKEDRNYLANKLYAEIFPILAKYEVKGHNAHSAAQRMSAQFLDDANEWVIRNIRTGQVS